MRSSSGINELAGSTTMNPGIIFRLIIFFTTITLLAALMAWTAHTSWRRTGELHEQLSAKQWKSFQIADHMQIGRAHV